MTQNWKQFIQQFPISNPSAKILVDLSRYGVIKVSGPDAAKFLQGQLSCDVLALQPGSHTLGAYCNIKGKIDSLFRLWRLGDDYFLRLSINLVQATIDELQKYAVFSKLNLQDVSEHICGFGVSNHIVNLQITDPGLAVLAIEPANRYEVYGPFAAISKVWQHCILEATHVDPYVWDVLDIKHRIPELYPQTIGEFFPHDLNLPQLGAVSFTKGCFRGQEIIARMQHRGKLKRSLYGFTAEQHRFVAGDKITAGGPEVESIAGTVVRVCRNVEGGVMGLAVITNSLATEKLAVGNHQIRLET
jgi:folate-binding protein YgfZ